jgi:hypothetical protein
MIGSIEKQDPGMNLMSRQQELYESWTKPIPSSYMPLVSFAGWRVRDELALEAGPRLRQVRTVLAGKKLKMPGLAVLR